MYIIFIITKPRNIMQHKKGSLLLLPYHTSYITVLTSRLRKANNSKTLNPTPYPELSNLLSNSEILDTRF